MLGENISVDKQSLSSNIRQILYSCLMTCLFTGSSAVMTSTPNTPAPKSDDEKGQETDEQKTENVSTAAQPQRYVTIIALSKLMLFCSGTVTVIHGTH